MKTVITSILILLIPMLGLSQQTVVSGKVQDNANKEAIPYATVSIQDSTLKTLAVGVTDDKGDFVLEKLPNGKMTITFSYIGYQNYSRTFEIISGRPKIELGTIDLHSDAVQLNAVEITGQKSSVSLKLDKKVFEVGKDVLSQNGSAHDVLNSVPSVTVSPTGGVSLRGNSSVLVLINGRQCS
jgi:hypothetical protein